MNASFCLKCGSVFPTGARSCPRCDSPVFLSVLKAGKALPVSRADDGTWYRDADCGRRWVAVTMNNGVQLFDPTVAPYRIRGDGKRIRGPYDPEVAGDWLVCREDWVTSDGVRWTLQWRFLIGPSAPVSPTGGTCEVVG